MKQSTLHQFSSWMAALATLIFLTAPHVTNNKTIKIPGKVTKGEADQVRGVEGSYVFLIGVPDTAGYASHDKKQVMDQVNQTFTPHILATQVGHKVIFQNSDPANHNVRLTLMQQEKQLINRMTPPGQSVSYTFEKGGIVSVQCDIHPSMQAYIPVLQEPFQLSRSDEEGNFTFHLPESLAKRKYHIKAWNRRFGWTDTIRIQITNNGIENPVRLTFD